MGNDVFANGRELSCKSGSGKSICAFPDVCFTPPQTPATPPGVPIPYPNTGMASDTSKGSRDVKITKKEVMLKNKSMFKKSVGDQAGCAPKKGVVTSQTGGKVYFNSWSMDVKIEGENAVRHLDLTTHNHGSVPGNSPTWPYIDQMAGSFPSKNPCKKDIAKEQDACSDFKPYGDQDPCKNFHFSGKKSKASNEDGLNLAQSTRSADAIDGKGKKLQFKGGEGVSPYKKVDNSNPKSAEECLTARACQLVPYGPKAGQAKCCPDQTPHHLVEAGSFFRVGRGVGRGKGDNKISAADDHAQNVLAATPDYKEGEAPSVCVWGHSWHRGTHGCIHTIQGNLNQNSPDRKSAQVPLANGETADLDTISYETARNNGIAAAAEVNPKGNCSKKCMEAQLDAYHRQQGVKHGERLRCVAAGYTSDANAIATRETLNQVNFGSKKFTSGN